MIITARDLLEIEEQVGHDCTASVRFTNGRFILRASAFPGRRQGDHSVCVFEQVITPETAHNVDDENLLQEFIAGAKQHISQYL